MRRLFHFVCATAAIACFFLSLYAINWIWTTKKPAIDTATRAFDGADKWLNIGNKTIDDVKENLRAAQMDVRRVNSTAGASGVKLNMMQKLVAGAAVNEVNQRFSNLDQTVNKVTEISIVVNSILESMHDIPFEKDEKIDVDRVRNLQAQVIGVTQASLQLGEVLSDVSPSDGESPGAKAARIDNSLNEIIAMANDFQLRVEALRKRLQLARADTLFWLNRGPTYLTIILGWIAFSQVLVIVMAVKLRCDGTTLLPNSSCRTLVFVSDLT